MAGVFDFGTGAFDSSEAGHLHRAFDIAVQGLRATHTVDAQVTQRLARSIIKVARTEPDCLGNDGRIDPVRLAQRAVLRMLQLNAPALERDASRPDEVKPTSLGVRAAEGEAGRRETVVRVMQKLFERTSFAKL